MKHLISKALVCAIPVMTMLFIAEQGQAQMSPPRVCDIPLDDFQKIAEEPGAVVFTPPKGWRLADAKALPTHVKIMVVGQGAYELPPSINLSTEEFDGTLKDYLRIVKEINRSQGSEWKDLGNIRTQAGDASLSQAEASTEWGSVRMMHVILAKNGMIYILTAAALKPEFPKFYKTFFESLRSLRINKDANEMARSPKEQKNLSPCCKKAFTENKDPCDIKA